jgi:hypothetical protein
MHRLEEGSLFLHRASIFDLLRRMRTIMQGNNKKSILRSGLNGWLRLWLLASWLWFFLVASLSIYKLPSESNIFDSLVESNSSIANSLSRYNSEARDYCFEKSQKEPPDARVEALRRCLEVNAKLGPSPDYIQQQREEATKQAAEQLPNEVQRIREEALVRASLYWITPVFSCLLLGVAAAWVRKGF